MRASWKAGIAAAGLGLFGAAVAPAQSWTITIGPDNKIASTTTLQAGKVNIITQDQATVSVQCPNGADCTKASLRLALTNLSPTSQSFTGSTFAIPKAGVSGATNLAVAFAGSDIGTFQVGPDTGGGGTPGTQGGQPPPSTAPTVAQLLVLPCPGTFSAGYDEKANQGEIVVTPLGVVLASGLDTLFDENDTLIVRVVADQRLLPLLTVARTSAFRTVTAVNVLGAGETAPTLTRQAGLVAECGERRFVLENFAPGQGTVQISALQGTQLTPTGSFDFNVNPLYTGMITLGAARTDLVNPSFTLASVNGQTVIVAGKGGNNNLVYALFYTPFVWGKRDIQKRVPFYKHLNPAIGVAPDDITHNAFVGISADLPAGITLTYGRHFGQIEVLTQGLTVGSAFSGTADQIPTSLEWKNDNFWAISIDIRVMVQILKAAMGSGGGR